MSITRKFSGSGNGKCNYVKNWDKLTKKQKKKLKDNGYYQNKSLAQAAAKKIAEKKAQEEAQRRKQISQPIGRSKRLNVKGIFTRKAE